MNGIASFLDHSADLRVRNLWQELESKCGLTGVKNTFHPHFTWQVTEGYDRDKIDLVLRKICRLSKSFTVRTGGLGFFTGDKPVIYLPILKDEALIHFHASLWKKTEPLGFHPWNIYSPDRWIPHITLAYNDVTSLNLACAVQSLAFEDHSWEIEIDNLVFFDEAEEDNSRMIRYEFGK
jgi:2'-5' RNA ligase